MLDYYIPIAGTTLLVSLIYKKSSADNLKNNENNISFVAVFVYILFLILIQFLIKDVIILHLQKVPSIVSEPLSSQYKMVLNEFDDIEDLPEKKGMILRNKQFSFLFGTVIQQNTQAYLVKNVFFSGSDKENNSLFLLAEHAKIIGHQIVLYKAVIFTNSSDMLVSVKELPKNYIIPMPFDMYTFFMMWNTMDPRYINLLPITLNNAFITSFMLPIVLAISNYILGFVFLLLIASLGISLKNSLYFKGINHTGGIAVLICSYPFCLLIYYYLSLIVQAVIHYFIKM